MYLSVFLQRLDSDELHAPFLRFFLQFRRPHHCAVVTHYLAAEAALLKTCDTHEVNGRFCVPHALKDAVLLSHKREHMPRLAEVIGLCLGRNSHSGGVAALCGGYARGGVNVVDGDRERR